MFPFRWILLAAFAALATTSAPRAAAETARGRMVVRAVVFDACSISVSGTATVSASTADTRASDAPAEAEAFLRASCTSGMREDAVLSSTGELLGGPRVSSAPLRREDPGGEWLASNPDARVMIMTITF